MSTLRPDIDDDLAETEALAAAVAEARTNRQGVTHDEMRAWLIKIAAGDLDAQPPVARPL